MSNWTDIKKLNVFTFFTMTAKFCIDLFLPVVLYKANYSIQAIYLFLLLTFVLNIIFVLPVSKVGQKVGFKYLIIISLGLFITFYFVVQNIVKNSLYFILIAFLSSLSNLLYYISRHNYVGNALDNTKKAKGVGGIMIATVLASMVASFLSSFVFTKVSTIMLCITVAIIYLIGIFFIFFIPVSQDKMVKIKEVSQKIKFNNKLFFLLEQFKYVFLALYPLYIYVFVDDSIKYLGIVYILTSIASIIFIYFYAKLIDKGKVNYLLLSAILLSITLFVDLYVFNKYIALIAVFLEGIFIKLYEVSATSNMYALRGKINGTSYYVYMEILYNISRFIIVFCAYIFGFKLLTVLYICILFVFLSGFVKLNFEDV